MAGWAEVGTALSRLERPHGAAGRGECRPYGAYHFELVQAPTSSRHYQRQREGERTMQDGQTLRLGAASCRTTLCGAPSVQSVCCFRQSSRAVPCRHAVFRDFTQWILMSSNQRSPASTRRIRLRSSVIVFVRRTRLSVCLSFHCMNLFWFHTNQMHFKTRALFSYRKMPLACFKHLGPIQNNVRIAFWCSISHASLQVQFCVAKGWEMISILSLYLPAQNLGLTLARQLKGRTKKWDATATKWTNLGLYRI